MRTVFEYRVESRVECRVECRAYFTVVIFKFVFLLNISRNVHAISLIFDRIVASFMSLMCSENLNADLT